MERFYVYTHSKADTEEVFYVGKGEARRHLSRSGRSEWWKRTAERHGLRSEIIERFADESDAFAMERYLIASYRALGMVLVNMTDGGEGCSGRILSSDHRKKISDAQKGRKHSAEQAEAHRVLMKGRRPSRETRAKMSAASKGRAASPETRAAMSAASKGRKKTAEHRAAMSAGQIAAFASGSRVAWKKTRVECVEAGASFMSICDAAKWLNEIGLVSAKTSGIQQALARSGLGYGYHWKRIE